MFVNATEFKNNLGQYLDMVDEEDIIIMRNGKWAAKLTSLNMDRKDAIEGLKGILPSDVSLEEAKEERTSKI